MNNSQFYIKLTVVHSILLLRFWPFSRATKWLWMCHKPPPGISSCRVIVLFREHVNRNSRIELPATFCAWQVGKEIHKKNSLMDQDHVSQPSNLSAQWYK